MDRAPNLDVPFSQEKEKLGHDENDSALYRYWVEPTPGSLRYTLQLRVEHYIELQRAEMYQVPMDDEEKRAARNLLLQDIEAVQRRIDHRRRPIWKYIIGLLVTGAFGQLHAHMNRIEEVLSSFVATNTWNSTILVNTTTSATTMATKTSGTIPRSVVLPWAAWTILTIFIVRSEFRQLVTRTISSSLKTLHHAAMLGNPVPPSELQKIERRWLWSFLLWKGEH
ncbi:hypothetical protein L211DRAFT_840243 [Terfezia boudieri ATCC MYA-4762]|uniref:Uncharacterized protein n=1 Tax=Terfezia boudieri ATCC MYA-4762 TaxID=1051890 RepID=A0A3N4LG79_9PEZI|nr:hypothetical protein L211DRAFT_840243 [Terfezia boudieri ATCC MYA-4762]